MNLRVSDSGLAENEARLLINFDVDDAGHLRARPDTERILKAPLTHSLIAHAGYLFFVSQGVLKRMIPGSAAESITTVGLSEISWAEHNGELFGSNGENHVRLDSAGNMVAWGITESFDDANGIRISAPTPANLLASCGAYLLMAYGAALRWTEPFSPDATDTLRNVLWLPDEIVTIAPVDNGLWLASRSRSWFYSGMTPADWQLVRSTNIGSISRQCIYDPDKPGKAIWLSDCGWVEASGDGQLLTPQISRMGVVGDSAAVARILVDGVARYVGALSGAKFNSAINNAAVTAALQVERG